MASSSLQALPSQSTSVYIYIHTCDSSISLTTLWCSMVSIFERLSPDGLFWSLTLCRSTPCAARLSRPGRARRGTASLRLQWVGSEVAGGCSLGEVPSRYPVVRCHVLEGYLTHHMDIRPTHATSIHTAYRLPQFIPCTARKTLSQNCSQTIPTTVPAHSFPPFGPAVAASPDGRPRAAALPGSRAQSDVVAAPGLLCSGELVG